MRDDESIFSRIGVRPWVLATVFASIAIVLICISIPWIVTTTETRRSHEREIVSIEAVNGLERISLSVEKARAMALGLAGYARSQMQFHPLPDFNTRDTTFNESLLTFNTAGFDAYCRSQQMSYPNIVKYFVVRPVGKRTNVYPSSLKNASYFDSHVPQDQYEEPFRTALNSGIARRQPVFLTTELPDTVLYSVVVPLYTNRTVKTQPKWVPVTGTPFAIQDNAWWGVVNVILDARTFIKEFVGLNADFDKLGYEFVVRFGEKYDPGLPTFRVVANNTNIASFLSAGDFLEERLFPADPAGLELYYFSIAIRPKSGWREPVKEGTIVGLIIAALAVASIVIIVWVVVALYLRYKADRFENRLHLAPKNLPVKLCMIEVVGVTSVWLADPIAMTRVTTRFRDIARRLSFDHDGYECRTIGDGMLIAFRRPDKMIGFAEAICEAMKAESWTAQERHHFPGHCIRVHATLHLCSRVHIRHAEGTACDYTGDDVRDLLQLHMESSNRQYPIVATDAFVTRLESKHIEKDLISADELTASMTEQFPERPPNKQLEGELKSQKLFPLRYSTAVSSPPLAAYLAVPLDDGKETSVSDENSTMQGSNEQAPGGDSGTATTSNKEKRSDPAASSHKSVCPPAIAERLMEVISQVVATTSAQTSMLYAASYFYEAYSIAFSPFEEKQLERIFKAIQDVFSLSATPGEVMERKELQIRLAVRCSRIYLHALKHREGTENSTAPPATGTIKSTTKEDKG